MVSPDMIHLVLARLLEYSAKSSGWANLHIIETSQTASQNAQALIRIFRFNFARTEPSMKIICCAFDACAYTHQFSRSSFALRRYSELFEDWTKCNYKLASFFIRFVDGWHSHFRLSGKKWSNGGMGEARSLSFAQLKTCKRAESRNVEQRSCMVGNRLRRVLVDRLTGWPAARFGISDFVKR